METTEIVEENAKEEIPSDSEHEFAALLARIKIQYPDEHAEALKRALTIH